MKMPCTASRDDHVFGGLLDLDPPILSQLVLELLLRTPELTV